jgi:hypothetical protein
MTASTSPTVASLPRTALLLGAGFLVAGAATSVVALAAFATGADPAFGPLLPPAYLTFTLLGLLGAYAGWRLVRRFAPQPARTLRVLVPVAIVLSLVPDVVLAVTRFIPGADTTAAVALGTMHLIVAGVAVPLFQRIAPVR